MEIVEYKPGFFNLNHTQKSPEWFEARKSIPLDKTGRCYYGAFGGTSLSGISGDSPYKSPTDIYRELIKSCPKCIEPCEHYALWSEEQQRAMDSNFHVERGRKFEDTVLKCVEQVLGVKIQDGLMGWRKGCEYIRVSPDGVDVNNVVYEFKCPYKLTPGVPVHYIPQIMGEMFVNGSNRCIYAAYCKGLINIYSVRFSEEYWQWLKRRADFIFNFARTSYPNLVTFPFPNEQYIDGGFADAWNAFERTEVPCQVNLQSLITEIVLNYPCG